MLPLCACSVVCEAEDPTFCCHVNVSLIFVYIASCLGVILPLVVVHHPVLGSYILSSKVMVLPVNFAGGVWTGSFSVAEKKKNMGRKILDAQGGVFLMLLSLSKTTFWGNKTLNALSK